MPAEQLGGEPSNVVDVLAGVPLIPGTDRPDCLGKDHESARGLGESLETGQACLPTRGRAGAMQAHDDRRDRRARCGLSHEVRAIGVAGGEDLLLAQRERSRELLLRLGPWFGIVAAECAVSRQAQQPAGEAGSRRRSAAFPVARERWWWRSAVITRR